MIVAELNMYECEVVFKQAGYITYDHCNKTDACIQLTTQIKIIHLRSASYVQEVMAVSCDFRYNILSGPLT